MDINYKLILTPQEWKLLQFAPLWVHSAIGLVDGKIDELEADVLGEEIKEAEFWKDPLTEGVFKSLAENIDTIFSEYIHDQRNVWDGLKETHELLKLKIPPTSARAFKKSLFIMAVRTAKASGIWINGKWSGTNVSDEEKDVINRLVAILDLPVKELE